MTTTTSKKETNELKILRFFEAPVETVWDAWTDDKQVSQWWGPRGFTITTHSKDLKTGGHWHYTMHGPDKVDYVNKTKYLEVVKYQKLHYDHGGNDEKKPMFRVTALFKEVKGGTLLDMTMAFPTVEEAVQGKKFIKKAGGNATWDRLAEYIDKKTTGKDNFVINRSFEAPRETIYEMWTNPKHFSQWLPPTGFNMEILKSDIKPGGFLNYSMTAENGGMTMYGRIDYLTFDKPNGLVYTQIFTDEKGNVARHPMAPTWPEKMQTTVKFTEEGPHQTRVTVKWEAVGKTSKEEMETFINARAGMTGGWTGSFDKLEEYLAKV